jgi:hypothetical protein
VENQFAEFEIMVIEKEVSRKSYQDIAFFLDRSVDDVREFIGEWIKNRGIIPYQQVLDESKPVKPPKEKKERAPRKNITAIQREKKEKVKRITSRVIVPDKRPAMNKRGVYRTRVVDYSQMQTVKIDEKTYIYIKLGEDPAQAKKKYLDNLAPRQFQSSEGKIVEVKKFKPIK